MENKEKDGDFASLQDIAELSNGEALSFIGNLIDRSSDNSDFNGLKRGIQLCDQLRARELEAEHMVLSYYFEANGWEELRRMNRANEDLWEWDQQEYAKAILVLRKARLLSANTELDPHRKAQISTNLANALSHVGRVVEAIAIYNDVLEEVDPFPMAQGNRGQGYHYYAQRTHDSGHQFLLMRKAHEDLQKTLKYQLHPSATKVFKVVAENILGFYGEKRLTQPFDLDHHSLGKEQEEIDYRKWALDRTLFLTPLNELGAYTVAAIDTLVLPGITQPISEGPYYLGFFNQMKQEYATARFSLYRGIMGFGNHYSDRGVKVINTLDYPVYSRWVEEIKTAFRVAYSIFDKVAYFLNHYFNLGIPERRVNFSNLWYKDRSRSKGVRDDIVSRNNIALQALYWVSKDIYEQTEDFQEVLEPEARELANIRNHIEHKYLKVHEFNLGLPPEEDSPLKGLADTLAYSISQTELQQKALRLLKMARDTLIYLVQAVYIEEVTKVVRQKGLIVPMFLDKYDDEWKQ